MGAIVLALVFSVVCLCGGVLANNFDSASVEHSMTVLSFDIPDFHRAVEQSLEAISEAHPDDLFSKQLRRLTAGKVSVSQLRHDVASSVLPELPQSTATIQMHVSSENRLVGVVVNDMQFPLPSLQLPNNVPNFVHIPKYLGVTSVKVGKPLQMLFSPDTQLQEDFGEFGSPSHPPSPHPHSPHPYISPGEYDIDPHPYITPGEYSRWEVDLEGEEGTEDEEVESDTICGHRGCYQRQRPPKKHVFASKVAYFLHGLGGGLLFVGMFFTIFNCDGGSYSNCSRPAANMMKIGAALLFAGEVTSIPRINSEFGIRYVASAQLLNN